MKKALMITLFLLLCNNTSYGQFFSMPDCSKVTFGEDNITIGSCKLNVYKAENYEQKVCGMLNFTDETFLKDGMIFIGDNSRIKSHNFHTEGMKMTIRIMGIVLQNNSNYKVYNNDAKYSPPGLPSVVIYGNSVFETSEEKFKKLNKCMFN